MSLANTMPIPHLTTAMTGPLHDLERHLLQQQVKIESWLRQQWRVTPPPVYCSVDLRNAGFKLAPIDTNLFPAGFNNLNPDFVSLSVQAAQATLETLHPGCTRILLIPESHTRNLRYFESVATLQDILLKAGFAVRIGSLIDDLQTAQTIELPSGRSILLEPVVRQGNRLGVADFAACVILLNHDLSGAVPAILQGLTQTINPPLNLGWATRLKSQHFTHYDRVAQEFSTQVGIDPWLINPLFRACGDVDFLKREGEDMIAAQVSEVLAAIQQKYQEYNISHKPFVIIKADAGTYGMGVMTARSVDDVINLNRKERTRMSASKGSQAVNKVIIQEGVYTFETWGKEQAVAEPVIYMLGQYVIGGFYRIHQNRGVDENLNAPGMQFEPLAFEKSCNTPDPCAAPDMCQNRFYAYGVIARLALVAAAREKCIAEGGTL